MTIPFTLVSVLPVGGATGGTPGTTGAGTPGCAVTGEAVATGAGTPGTTGAGVAAGAPGTAGAGVAAVPTSEVTHQRLKSCQWSPEQLPSAGDGRTQSSEHWLQLLMFTSHSSDGKHIDNNKI